MEHLKRHFTAKEPMEDKLKLKKEHINILSKLPEKGMGYQLVDITLKNGDLLKNRIILNACYLKLNESEKLNADDIEKIELHQE